MLVIKVNETQLQHVLGLQSSANINPTKIYSAMVDIGSSLEEFYVEYSAEVARRVVLHSEDLALLIALKLLKDMK